MNFSEVEELVWHNTWDAPTTSLRLGLRLEEVQDELLKNRLATLEEIYSWKKMFKSISSQPNFQYKPAAVHYVRATNTK